ncbi:MAG: amino acid carrier protein [Firmicutes bacterium]|nr:amino acid carrier protein [Bacillota bacterium]
MLDTAARALSALMIPLLFTAGLYFGFATRFFYIFHPIKTLRRVFGKRDGGISPLRAASVALAGTLGVGNITGVITAIYSGGPGAVFWMWVSALAAMSVKYAETALAVRFRRGAAGEHYGGAPFYIRDGLGGGKLARALGGFFAVLCVINSFVVGNILQINAAASAAHDAFGINPVAVGAASALLTFAVIIGGAKRISALTSRLIPAVSLLYIFMCVSVIFAYGEYFCDALFDIFTSAFSFRSALGGAGGYTVAEAVRFGVTRGILTNEAGSGTSPTAHACSDAKSPHEQGTLGIFEVFVDTILICSLTAFAILTASRAGITLSDDPMRAASLAFSSVLGALAPPLLTAVSVMFVFATVISQHYYGETAIRYLFPGSGARRAYTLLYVCAAVVGSVISPAVMWNAADIIVGAMTSVNVVCLLLERRYFRRGEARINRPDLPII